MRFVPKPFRLLWLVLLAVLLAIVPLLHHPAVSQDPPLAVEAVPNPRAEYGGWVSDAADLLSPGTETQLNRIATELEAAQGAEMAVVTVPSAAAEASPQAFATKLFNTWGIGKADANNGVLVLLSGGDRRIAIETGAGLPAILPDTRVQEIIDQQMLPSFQQGDFDTGTLAGVQAIADVLTGQSVAIPPATPPNSPATSSSTTVTYDLSWLAQPFDRATQLFWFFTGAAFAILSFVLYKAARARSQQRLVLPLGERSRVAASDSDRPRLWKLKVYRVAFTSMIGPLLWLGLTSHYAYPIAILIAGLSLGAWLFVVLLRALSINTQYSQGTLFFFALLLFLTVSTFLLPVAGSMLGFFVMLLFSLPAPVWSLLIVGLGEPLSLFLCAAIVAAIAAKPLAALLEYRLLRYQPIFYGDRPAVPLEPAPDSAVKVQLSPAEAVAADLGSVQFQGWRLPGRSSAAAMHIRAIEKPYHIYKWCRSCQEWTVEIEREVVEEATHQRSGRRKITERCHCCQAKQIDFQPIPQIKRRYHSSGSRHASSKQFRQ